MSAFVCVNHASRNCPHRLLLADSEDLIESDSTAIQPFALLCGHHTEPISALVCAVEGAGAREPTKEKNVLVSADLSSCMCVWSLEDGVCLRVCRSLAQSIAPEHHSDWRIAGLLSRGVLLLWSTCRARARRSSRPPVAPQTSRRVPFPSSFLAASLHGGARAPAVPRRRPARVGPRPAAAPTAGP